MNEHQPQPEQPDRESSHDRQPSESPRVWLGSLADYNNGTLHGDWVDATVDDDDLLAAAKAIIDTSETPGAEEWAIFDYEGFGDLRLGESEDLRVVAAVARGIQEHGPAFAAWAELHDCDPAMLASFSEAYLGEYDSAADWAATVVADFDVERTLEEHLPEWIARYTRVDLEALAQDAWLSGDVYVVHKPGGGVWLFDTRL